jgi:thiol-disulfide isomerase/thioredoxin
LIYSSFSKIVDKKQFNAKIKSVPKSSIFHWIGTKPGINNQKTIILFFHPECEHCQYEAKTIVSELNQFGSTNIWWISSADKSSIQLFLKKYQLNTLPNQYFAHLPIELISTTFGSISVPHIFIYDENQHLLKEFKGETKIEALLKYLH